MAIKDMQGRVNVGVVLAAGRKGPTGAPIERDRLHLVWPVEDAHRVRPPHPQFARFNQADATRRRTIYGVLTHATEAECFEYNYRAQAPRGEKAPPSGRPFCSGDGETALRFRGLDNGDERFEPCACPARACPYQQTNPAGCKAHMRLLFMLAWPASADMPSMLCKFTSNSYHTTAGMVGFFQTVYSVAASFGLSPEQVSLAGLRFVLTLTERTNSARKSRYPVVTITPVDNMVEFLEAQAQRSRALIEARRPIAALTDRQEQDPTTTRQDYDACEVVSSDLSAVLESAGLTIAACDAWLASQGKPPASTGDEAAQARLAGWLTAKPERLDTLRQFMPQTQPEIPTEPSDQDF